MYIYICIYRYRSAPENKQTPARGKQTLGIEAKQFHGVQVSRSEH